MEYAQDQELPEFGLTHYKELHPIWLVLWEECGLLSVNRGVVLCWNE